MKLGEFFPDTTLGRIIGIIMLVIFTNQFMMLTDRFIGVGPTLPPVMFTAAVGTAAGLLLFRQGRIAGRREGVQVASHNQMPIIRTLTITSHAQHGTLKENGLVPAARERAQRLESNISDIEELFPISADEEASMAIIEELQKESGVENLNPVDMMDNDEG